MSKTIYLFIFLLFSIINSARAVNDIIVNEPLNFGEITYDSSKAGYFTIGGVNYLLVSGSRADYKNVRPAVITLIGRPNEVVELSFTKTPLTGNKGGFINIQDIKPLHAPPLNVLSFKTSNFSKVVSLGITGRAVVNLSGSLLLNNPNLAGEFRGSFIVTAHTVQPNTRFFVSSAIGAMVTQRVEVRANINNKNLFKTYYIPNIKVNDTPLSFGTITYFGKSCMVKVDVNGKASPSNPEGCRFDTKHHQASVFLGARYNGDPDIKIASIGPDPLTLYDQNGGRMKIEAFKKNNIKKYSGINCGSLDEPIGCSTFYVDVGGTLNISGPIKADKYNSKKFYITLAN